MIKTAYEAYNLELSLNDEEEISLKQFRKMIEADCLPLFTNGITDTFYKPSTSQIIKVKACTDTIVEAVRIPTQLFYKHISKIMNSDFILS